MHFTDIFLQLAVWALFSAFFVCYNCVVVAKGKELSEGFEGLMLKIGEAKKIVKREKAVKRRGGRTMKKKEEAADQKDWF